MTDTAQGTIAARPVSVVIPCYNNLPLLARYLPPLMEELSARGAGDEVIVADDASQDDTPAYIRDCWPSVRYVRNAENGGFGAACNTGIAAARNPYVLLLNSDVRVTPGFLDPLLAHFDRPEIFAVVPRIVRPGTPAVCQSLTGFRYLPGYFELRWDEFPACHDPRPVIFPSGACALIDAAKLRAIGGIDSLYRPFYMEDVDLGYVAWKRGWICLYEPTATVTHEEGATVRKQAARERVSVINTRNRYLFVWKNISDHRLLILHVALIFPRAVSAWVRRGDPMPLRGFLAAIPRLGEALAARRREKPFAVRSDREVAEMFSGWEAAR